MPGLMMTGCADGGATFGTGAGEGAETADGAAEPASFVATGAAAGACGATGFGVARFGASRFWIVSFGAVRLGVALGTAGSGFAGFADATSAGVEGGGAGICSVGFVTAAVVFAGKDALILLDEASAVVGSALWGTELPTFGTGARRVRRGRPEAGGGLPALGGFAILGFTPLFRHINEIRDRGAILPSA